MDDFFLDGGDTAQKADADKDTDFFLDGKGQPSFQPKSGDNPTKNGGNPHKNGDNPIKNGGNSTGDDVNLSKSGSNQASNDNNLPKSNSNLTRDDGNLSKSNSNLTGDDDNLPESGGNSTGNDANVVADVTLSIDDVYSLLKLNELDSDAAEKIDYEVYFKGNIDIFKVMALPVYNSPSKEEFCAFEKRCGEWETVAVREWSQPSNRDKVNILLMALNGLKSIFHYADKAQEYIKQMKDASKKKLDGMIFEKMEDGFLDILEIAKLLETGEKLHVVDTVADKRDLLDDIEHFAIERGCTIGTMATTFVNNVRVLDKFDRIDTKENCDNLFCEYKKLLETDAKLQRIRGCGKDGAEEGDLHNEMLSLLRNSKDADGNPLIFSHVEYYRTNFFDVEKKKKRYDFRFRLPAKYFYYLQGVAINTYGFTEGVDGDWSVFAREERLSMAEDSSVQFIIGGKKAYFDKDIAAMMLECPTMAVQRVRERDLQTFFLHIGRADFAKKIDALLGEDDGMLLQDVVALLGGSKDDEPPSKKEINMLTMLIFADKEVSAVEDFLLENRENETLFSAILKKGELQSLLSSFLLRKGQSLRKLLFNLMYLLSQEGDFSCRVYLCEEICLAILQDLQDKKDSTAFKCVYEPLIDALHINFCKNFLNKYSEIKKTLCPATDLSLQNGELGKASAHRAKKINKVRLFWSKN